MALNLGTNEYKGYQKTGGKHNNSGPVGRKAGIWAAYRRAQANHAVNYWKAYGARVHGVNRAVRLVYWT